MSEFSEALQAVGHPVRVRLLQRLAGDETATVSELAEAAGVHENTVRPHVAVLEEAGLIAGEPRLAAGPGRPGVQYRLTVAGERVGQDFFGLAELLAAVIGRAGVSRSQLREVGRAWGRYLAGRPGQYEPSERVPDVLRGLGFEAAVKDDRVRLTGCPCPVVASDRPDLICQLAAGVVEGVLESSGGRLRVGDERHDPPNRDCRIELVHVSGSPDR